MIKKIKSYVMSALMVVSMAAPAPVLVGAVASAECSTIAKNVGNGAGQAAGDTTGAGAANCGDAGVSTDSLGNAAKGLVRVFSLVVGVAAIVMIIYSGFRYITSGGDSTRVGNAKNTLIYAIVGLIVVALAQVIVRFVLNQSSSITTA